MNVLEVTAMNKVYPGKVLTQALTDIHLSIEQGEFVGIMGPSGSGKTTLLNMVSTIDQPSSGEVKIDGSNPYQMNKKSWPCSAAESLALCSRISTCWRH